MNTSSIATVLRSSVLLMILVPLLTAPVIEAQCGNPSGSFQCFQSCYFGGYCYSDICEFDACVPGFACGATTEYVNYCISITYFCFGLFTGCYNSCSYCY